MQNDVARSSIEAEFKAMTTDIGVAIAEDYS